MLPPDPKLVHLASGARGGYHDAGFVCHPAEATVSVGTPSISGDTFTLFVYGTLMRRGPRHRVLAGQRFLGEARTRPLYALYDLGDFPGLVRREADGRAVWGELYEVAADLVARLDRIEGAPNLYRLEPVLIEGHAGRVLAYFYRQDTHGVPLCAGDRWQNC
jgi:gamma-glutamylcyclotransferase (GGCT)/AIG2-like uncharacterized protein YtfP